jgi:predicted esterase
LGGLSQGHSLAMATFLNYKGKTPLGGVFGFNGFQCFKFNEHEFPEKQLKVMQRTPLLLYNDVDNMFNSMKNLHLSYKFFKDKVYVDEHKKRY